MKIKTGDKVRVLVGKDKGKEGKVLQTFPKLNRVVVEGLNLAKRHLRRRTRDTQGQTIEFPAPMHVSNVAIISSKTGKTGRVGAKVMTKDGARTRVRILRKKGSAEDIE